MSYYVTNDNSFLDIKNAHLRVSGNVHTDVNMWTYAPIPPGKTRDEVVLYESQVEL